MNYPNYKKGFRWGLISGLVCLVLFFAAKYFLSKLPSDVSILGSRPWWAAFQPWWKDWEIGLVIFIVVALVVGILAAFRPNFPK
jgi:hypothetical protein